MNAPTCRSSKERLGGLHYTTEHEGKMYGVWSLSTSYACNPLCLERVNSNVEGLICKKCFSKRFHKLRPSIYEAFKENYRIMNSAILDDVYIPKIKLATNIFRGESFGDFGSWIAVANFFKICAKNPTVDCAMWTKNPWFVAEAIEKGYKKPKNLQIVYSSPFINKEAVPKYDFIDKVFTVYDTKYIKENHIEINCGARSCVLCRKCYQKNKRGVKVEFIREKLK